MTPKQQKQAPSAPPEDWQTPALQLAIECAQRLHKLGAGWIETNAPDPDWRQAPTEAGVYHWLREKCGLQPQTISDSLLGFNPDWRELPSGQRLAPGVTIPCFAGAVYPLQYINTRLTKEASEQLGRQYAQLEGGNPAALYGALPSHFGHRYAILVPTELEALLLSQHAGDLAAVVATADPQTLPDPAFLDSFEDLQAVFAHGRNRSPPQTQPMPAGPRHGQDLAGWAAAGGELRAWVEEAIRTRWRL